MLHWEKFLHTLSHVMRAKRLVRPQDRVLAAVSGGLDSVAMFKGLAALRESLQLSDLVVVYVDHGLRPAQTPAEAQWVENLAIQHGCSFYLGKLTIPQHGDSIQTEARHLRREQLETLAHRAGCSWIATGHHADDQAETLMQRWLRGTGPRGLAGIWPQQGMWIHPLLSFTRATLQQVAEEQQWTWLEDPSNTTPCYNRNRLRLELIPQLEREYNPQLRTHLCRIAEWMQIDEQYFAQQMQEHWVKPWVEIVAQGVVIDLQHWQALPFALQWRLLRHALQFMLQGQDLPQVHLERLIDLAQTQTGSRTLDVPAPLRIVREYHLLFLTHPALSVAEDRDLLKPPTTPVVEIHPPGMYTTPWGTVKLEQWWNGPSLPQEQSVPPSWQEETWACFLSDEIDFLGADFPWTMRTRMPGDLLDFGTHHRPLKKWMIDAKIPRLLRGEIPVLERQGMIRCILGWLCLPPFTLTPPRRGWRILWTPCSSPTSKTFSTYGVSS